MTHRKGFPSFSLLIVVVALATAAVVLRGQTASSGLPPFGNPDKAEFYPLQTDPESSDGAFVPINGSAEVDYVVPSVLLGATAVATVNVVSTGIPNMYAVSISLSSTGSSTLAKFILDNGADASIGLVWNNNVVGTHTASELNTGGEIIVATDLLLSDANALALALQ
jgi:hypothetical protein